MKIWFFVVYIYIYIYIYTHYCANDLGKCTFLTFMNNDCCFWGQSMNILQFIHLKTVVLKYINNSKIKHN